MSFSDLIAEQGQSTAGTVGQLFACRSCRAVEFRRPGEASLVADLSDSPVWNRWG